MDSRSYLSSASFSLFFFLLLLPITVRGAGGGVFRVQRRFVAGRGDHSIADLRNHDASRHSRLLSATAAVDLPLGGNGLPTATGLYYTDIGIGTPAKNFTVQVDTGSDILWVNCAPCDGCPEKTHLGIDLLPYDPKNSTSAKELGCGENFCSEVYGGEDSKCTQDGPCKFQAVYGDGSVASGYFVTDLVTYNQVSSDHITQPATANITFGCAAKQIGTSTGGLEGLIGFGQANSSTISQLVSSGRVRKIFAHCLDTIKGGGIFAIGNVVQPEVKTTPLIPNMAHYNVNMTAIAVGNKTLRLPQAMFWTNEDTGTIIDSGATLAYLPDLAYNRVVDEIFANHPNLKQTSQDNFTCFSYSESVDDAFPVVTFHFEKSVTLQVQPHDYFFQYKDDWCISWQNGGTQHRFLLGDMALSNKLVVYDLEKQAIGWTEYDCSSTIQVEDTSNEVHTVNAHALSSIPSSADGLDMRRYTALMPLAFLLCLLHSLIQINYSKQVLSETSSFIWTVFNQPSEADRKTVDHVTLIVDDYKGVACASNDEIHVSSNYIAGYPGDVKTEITGVLYHESTHVWQWNGQGNAPGGLIEGMADFVRLRANYAPSHWVKPGEGQRWDQGYDVTARFLDYCNSVVRDGFVAELNRKMRDGYSDGFFQELVGNNVDQMWSEYKAYYGAN